MRIIVYGAGGIGGGIAGLLHKARHDVVAIARGDHLAAIQAKGLRVRTPERTWTSKLTAVGHPSEIDWTDDAVVLLTTKSQDTPAALADLEAAAGPNVPIVCCQNGVANERIARRRFERVYAMLVVYPAMFLEPGVVDLHGTPNSGLLDAGRFPDGVDATITEICDTLTDSGFVARPDPRAMRLKYGKLLDNLSNAIEALCGLGVFREPASREFAAHMREEAIDCYRAAGIDYASREEIGEMRKEVFELGEIKGSRRAGGSTWQSFERGLRGIETDYLNGEIVLLGALHGVLTPYNRVLQTTTKRALLDGVAPGSYAVEQLQALVDEAELLDEIEG